MTQKKEKKCVASHGHGNLANRKPMKSILNTQKINQIISNIEKISNGEEEKSNGCLCQPKSKKNNQICRGKSTVQQMEIHQVTRIPLSEEIMMDILIRLPVRSLLRFKCVSKCWNSLINDPYLKRTHYIHNRDDQNSQKILISQCLFTTKDGFHFYTKQDAFSFYTCSLSLLEDEQKLDWPSTHARICGCCDGLVLILVSFSRLYLWNPSTRESILLPEFRIRRVVCGLAYDATSEDYKILAMNLNADPNSHTSLIEVLSLKSGSWRRIGYPTGIQRVCGFRDCGMDYLAFLHGAFHWLGKSPSGCYTIVSFNISNEVYGEVPLLEQMYDLCPYYSFLDHGVSVLRGMLCFYSTYNYLTEGMDCTFKLWVMKDYGVKESWTELIKLRDTNLFHSSRPQYMFADGEVLLHCKYFGCVGSKFMLSTGPFGLCRECVILKQGIVYAESFISPSSLT